jgi:glycosyltransferase involved in cell wall biosynthesis
VWYIAALLRRLRHCDVVHAFSASYWSFVLAPLPALVVGKLYGRGTVLNYRSGEADDHLTRWRPVVPPLIRALADAVVTPSTYLVDVFARHGLSARSISNFVELERLPYRRRDTLRPIFLSNRNLEPLYDVETALRAFALIQREVPEARLVVAGGGSQRDHLESLAGELGLRETTFVGQVSADAMARLYDSSDILLNTPRIDNMPNTLIEAFAAGLPIVTTDAGGIPYIVDNGRTGLIVRAGDVPAVAAAALRLLREPGLAQRIATAARDEVISRYTWGAVGDAWESLYRGVASPRGVAA